MENSSTSPDRMRFASRRLNVLLLAYACVLCASLLACSNQREANEPSAAPAMMTEPAKPAMTESSPPSAGAEPPQAVVQPGDERSTSMSAGSASVDPQALDRFVAAVEPLGTGAMDRSHDTTVEALRAFAGALATLPRVDRTASDDVRSTAERLASSDPSSLEHADMVKHALETGLSALSAQDIAANQQARFEDAGRAMRGAVEAIDVQEPLLQQRDDVARAFRAAANMVAIAGNSRAPFPPGETGAG